MKKLPWGQGGTLLPMLKNLTPGETTIGALKLFSLLFALRRGAWHDSTPQGSAGGTPSGGRTVGGWRWPVRRRAGPLLFLPWLPGRRAAALAVAQVNNA